MREKRESRITHHASRITGRFALTTAFLCLTAAPLFATNLPPATVSFLDGSFLRGEIESLNSETLKWRHPNALQPIEFTTTNLNSVRMPARALALPTNSAPVCRVQLASGDEFEGQLLSLDGENFEIETWFAGRLRGQRAGLASLAFYGSSQSALYDGPRAADEWKISSGAAAANRIAFDAFGNNMNFMPAIRIAAPARPAAEPTPQEAVIQLKAEIARLGEKGSAVLRQALEKRLKEVEDAAAKAPVKAVEPKAPIAIPLPAAPQAQRFPVRAVPVPLPIRDAPPTAPAVDPAAQTLKMELDRKLKELAQPGERPPLPPPKLAGGDAAPAPAFNKKPTTPEISTMASRARLAATVADYLKTDLVLLAVEAGLVKEPAVKADLEKQVEVGDARTVIRREGALLTARLLRELEHLKNDPSAIALTRTYDLLGGVRAAAAAPAAIQPHAVAAIMKFVETAQKSAAAGEFIKSDLVRAAVDADLASERALERWFEDYTDAAVVARDKAKETRFKALVKAEAAQLGARLLQTLAAGAGFAEAGELAQQLAQAQADLGQGALVMAQANALAEARVRALGALQFNNLNVVGAAGAEGVLAGRAVAAANTNAAWTFRDGAYYSSTVGTLGRECQLPTKARIEFDLAWKGQPYFRFSFFTRSTEQFDFSDGWQFYTSSSGYIYSMRRSGMNATSSTGARVPQMLNKSTVRLTFLVNTETEVTTLLADGEKVHEWKNMGSPGNGTAVVFYNYNTSSRVRLSDIRITPWDGRVDREREPLGVPGADPDKLVEVPPPDTAVVEFVNQDRATGTLHGIRDGKLAFNPAGTKLEIPLTRAALIAFPVNAAPELPKLEGVQVTLHRNERLTLALEKWGPGEVTAVSPVFGRLTLKPESIRALRFNPSAPRGPVDEWGGP